jgi:hypothetical protein
LNTLPINGHGVQSFRTAIGFTLALKTTQTRMAIARCRLDPNAAKPDELVDFVLRALKG